MVIDNDKIYFVPGDIVVVRHEELDNRPAMYVVEKVSKTFINKEFHLLIQMHFFIILENSRNLEWLFIALWFTKVQILQYL